MTWLQRPPGHINDARSTGSILTDTVMGFTTPCGTSEHKIIVPRPRKLTYPDDIRYTQPTTIKYTEFLAWWKSLALVLSVFVMSIWRPFAITKCRIERSWQGFTLQRITRYSLALGRCGNNFTSLVFKVILCMNILMTNVPSECHDILLMISQHWLTHQWNNVEDTLVHWHMCVDNHYIP